ncbi:MAG: hypothetical protein JJT82_04440 [Legionellaceae bacterium]|nr:hypothetical protein [Legionellaceae bacterium]
MLAIDTPLQKLGALMGLISGHLAKAFIKKPSDISALLMPLSAERINVVLGAMKEKLSEIIQNATGFKQMLQPLTPEQRTSIYLAIVDKLPELIRRPADLGLALQYLSPGQGTDVCRAMQEQEKLSEIFKYPTDLGLALQYLTPEQFTAVCSAMQEKLPQMIRGAGGLQYVFQHLTPEQSAAVCSAVREKLSGMIKNAGDFAMLLTYLSPEQRSGIYLAMKNKLPDIIKNPSELTSFLARTNVEIQQHFFESGSADDLLAKIMLNVHKDIPECHQKLLSNEVKNAFNKSCFSGLLLNLKRNAGNLHNKNTYNSFLKIIDQLDQESSQYFNAYPQNQEELEIFQRNCNTSINLVKNILRYHESLGTSLGKKLLSVVSFSLNTLASITKSTQTTGVYQCRFFDTPGEQAADNVSGLLNLLPKPKP